MLFRSLLGVPIFNSNFIVFLYAASMQWGVDVTRFDLTPEHSQAAFVFFDLLQGAQTQPKRHNVLARSLLEAYDPQGAAPMQLDAHARSLDNGHTDAVSGSHGALGFAANSEVPPAYAMNKANARAVQKCGGSSRWAQRLRRMIAKVRQSLCPAPQ